MTDSVEPVAAPLAERIWLWVGVVCTALGVYAAGSFVVDQVQVVGTDTLEATTKTWLFGSAIPLLAVGIYALRRTLPGLMLAPKIVMPPVLNQAETLSEGQGIGGIGRSVADQAADFLAQQVEFVRRPLTHPDAQKLVAELQQEYVRIYGGEDDTPMQPAQFSPPVGDFYVGYVGGEPVAMGGWRFRELMIDGVWRPTEIKRMYVTGSHRRLGLARKLLKHLEDTAREGGAKLMILETGDKQPDAVALYEAAGYQPTERFGHYADMPHTIYLAREL